MEYRKEFTQVGAKKIERVRQAAAMLGISERTVYRRLRAGDISDLPEANPSAVNDMTTDKILSLEQTLVTRDEQITALLERQKELTAAVQQLQNQMCELARLALTQTVAMTPIVPPVPAETSKLANSARQSLWDRVRGRHSDK